MDKDLADLVGFYQRELAETEAGRKLLERLELDSPEAVEHFGLGYASGLAAKVASASQLERLRALGLVRGRRYELLSRCLVIPVYDAGGELVDLCGIRAYASQTKYVHWQPEHRGLIGAAALGTYTEVVLCDAPLQALHVRRHGHANVVALRGAGELAGHLELFRKSGVKRVYLVSRKCRAELASQLGAAGIETAVVPYPSQAAAVPAESLRAAVPEAAGGEGAELELVGRTDQYVSFAAGGVAYRLEAAGQMGVSLRSVVRAERGGRSHIDRLDLASASARRKYARGCAARLRVSSSAVEGHLAAMAERVEKLDAGLAGALPGSEDLTAGEREAGLGLLKGEGGPSGSGLE